jgi:hypothetical protein
MLKGRHVKHRRPGNEGIVLRKAEVDAADIHARQFGAMTDERAFWQPSGPAGIENEEAIFRLSDDSRFLVGVTSKQVFVCVSEAKDGTAPSSFLQPRCEAAAFVRYSTITF